jgi:hypothetical protein
MSKTAEILFMYQALQSSNLQNYGLSNLTWTKLEPFDGLRDISSLASYKAGCSPISLTLLGQAQPEYFRACWSRKREVLFPSKPMSRPIAADSFFRV